VLGMTAEELAELGVKREGPFTYKLEDDVFPVELEFQTGAQVPPLGPMLMKIPSQLPAACEHRWSSLDDPKYRRFYLEPLMGMNLDLIEDERERRRGPPLPEMDPEDRPLLELARDILGSEEVDVIMEHGLGATKVLEEMKKNKKSGGTQADESAKLRESAAQGANWLKNTTYLSNNLHESVHAFKSGAEEKARIARLREDEDEDEAGYDAALKSFRDAKRPLEHSGDPTLTVEWELPLFPDAALWANDYVRVDVDNEPPSDGSLLASQIFTTEKKSRGSKSLSTSVSVPVSDETPDGRVDYEWSRQYYLTIREDGRADDRLALFLGPTQATYVVEPSKRAELDHCRLPRAAALERRTADLANDYVWTGKTELVFDRQTAFDPAARNDIRRKLRQVNVDVSDDEDDAPAEDAADDDLDDAAALDDDQPPLDARDATDDAHRDATDHPHVPAEPLIEDEADDDL